MKTILVADDSKTIQQVVDLTFRATHFKVVAAMSAADARSAVERETPDIILADVTMADTDGYTLCQELRGHDTTRLVPILLLGGAFQPVDQQRADAAGASGHLIKPFDSQTLIDRVAELTGVPSVAPPPMSFEDRLAQHARGNGSAAGAVSSSPPAPAPAPALAAAADLEVAPPAAEPMIEAPADDGFAPDVPVDDGFATQAPVDDGFAMQAPVDDGFAMQAAADDGFAMQAPADDGFAAQAPVDDAVAIEAPVVDDGFAAQAPVDDAAVAIEAPVVDDGFAIESPVVDDGFAIEPPLDDGLAVEAPIDAPVADAFAIDAPVEAPSEALLQAAAAEDAAFAASGPATEAAPPPPGLVAQAFGGLAAGAGLIAGSLAGDAAASPADGLTDAPADDDFAMEAPVEAAAESLELEPIPLDDGIEPIALDEVIEPIPQAAMSYAPAPGPESLPADAFNSVHPSMAPALDPAADPSLMSFPPQPAVTQPPGFAAAVPAGVEAYDSVPDGFVVADPPPQELAQEVALVDEAPQFVAPEAPPPAIDDLIAPMDAPPFAAPAVEGGVADIEPTAGEIAMTAADLESAAPSLEAPPPPGAYSAESANVDVWSLAEPGAEAVDSGAPSPAWEEHGPDGAIAPPDSWSVQQAGPEAEDWSEAGAQPSWEMPVDDVAAAGLPVEGWSPPPGQWQQPEAAAAPPPAGAPDVVEPVAAFEAPAIELAPPVAPDVVELPPEVAAAPVAAAVSAVAAQVAAPMAEAVAVSVPGLPHDELVAIARGVIEQVAWEVVPDLAEAIIRAELDRLIAED